MTVGGNFSSDALDVVPSTRFDLKVRIEHPA
jgi:hypothetical protein